MFVLRIEHPVPTFEGWQKAFDSDPVGRQKNGVRGHRVFRPADDPLYVIVDLDLETLADAEAFLTKLKALWSRVEGKVMTAPRARILEVTAQKSY